MSDGGRADLVGSVLEGIYRIDGVLGEGGMGMVYKATHLRLRRRVAVKVMAKELTANAEALARFYREAEITGGLGHPHIVQVFDFSSTPDGEPFLVMEFLEGEDLDHRLRRLSRLSAADTAHIIRQTASALDATHARGIVHRDLKPANIFLVDAEGEKDFVKVLDFGISKARAASRLTRTASVMGTPDYMSPEQALGRTDEIDEATDQWALACIAWECLAGRQPFGGEQSMAILYQVVHEKPSSLLDQVAGLPADVETVLLRALSKNKADRFPNIEAFAGAFLNAIAAAASVATGAEAVADGVESAEPRPSRSGARTPTRRDDGGEPTPTTLRASAGEVDTAVRARRVRSRVLWPLGGAVLGVAVLAAFILARGRTPPPRTETARPAPVPSTPEPPQAALPARSPELQPPPPVPAAPEAEPVRPPVADQPVPAAEERVPSSASKARLGNGPRRTKKNPASAPETGHKDSPRRESESPPTTQRRLIEDL